MTTKEFSSEFDILLDSYRRIKKFDDKEMLDSIEFNEYEKSLFLTRAQQNVVIDIYNGMSTPSFESTEESKRYLSNLVKTIAITEKQNHDGLLTTESTVFKLPNDTLFITYEQAKFNPTSNINDWIIVIPTTQDEYYRISANPFRGPSKNRILRLNLDNNYVELISIYPIDTYLIRYMASPPPIILENLQDISIDGISITSECTLDPILHKLILSRAVDDALKTKLIYSNKNSN